MKMGNQKKELGKEDEAAGKKIKQVVMLQFELNVNGIIEAVLTGNLNTDALLKTRSVVRGTNNS